MVIEYSINIIPSTFSDKSTQHYKLKKILIEHLKSNDDILDSIRMVYYEEISITLSKKEKGYTPDVIFFKKDEELWLEIETDPFNVFKKLVKLFYLQTFDLPHWPSMLIFGVPLNFYKEDRYLKVFDELRKLLKIKEVRIYFIDKDVKKMR